MYEGQLISLRPVEPEDLPMLADLANDPNVRQLVVGWNWPMSLAGHLPWFESASTSSTTRRLAIVDQVTGESIGVTGLWDLDWHNRSAMTGIKLDTSKSPRGAGTEAVMMVNAWAFYEVSLHRLWGSILDFNSASFHLYVHKCGWRLEGVERQSVQRAGAWSDLYRVAILRSDFDAHPGSSAYRDLICPVETTPFPLSERPE